eukprot:CAMPEP_0173086164 /NCGR_PEP_ID=MMETSP1102-20130122/22494_1 /TAXON_ID=49646 /ORGANISM="Geminigera sp., Strain Caron Lab Isolate" /LENGTH=81 /DNA_ID=CAMNT_0013966461 /DNA_START=175 /DNA_END=421 /DNA_ORIENTATION=-
MVGEADRRIVFPWDHDQPLDTSPGITPSHWTPKTSGRGCTSRQLRRCASSPPLLVATVTEVAVGVKEHEEEQVKQQVCLRA